MLVVTLEYGPVLLASIFIIISVETVTIIVYKNSIQTSLSLLSSLGLQDTILVLSRLGNYN